MPFYILGFTEALVRSFSATRPYFAVIAATVTLLLFFVSYVGARWAIKTQYAIMAVLALSIVAFTGGALQNFSSALFIANWSSAFSGQGVSFWAVFAIYFPAVTGIMAGVNMSGDLKEMVLPAHLLTLNWYWTEAQIRLLRLIDDEAGRGPSTQALQDLLTQARVKADVQILVSTAPFVEVLQRHSADASVVLLGFNVPEERSALAFQSHYEQVMDNLPTTLLIASSGQADLFA